MTDTTCLQIDAFADRAFGGNPAAVCLLEDERDALWMQQVAAEMNLSETAFVRPVKGGFDLRWFTSEVEVDLCGHATLASAHALWDQQLVPLDDSIVFHTRSGDLTCSTDGEMIYLDLPAATSQVSASNGALADALGTTPSLVASSKDNLLALLDSESVLRALTPDFAALARLPASIIMVTSPSDDPKFDFVSRVFGPAVGIDEDPVTGAAHCCLGPFWGERLGKNEMTAYQASARGGVVQIRLEDDRITLGGKAITVFRGLLSV